MVRDKDSRRRICVVITARPSYARIKTALSAIASRGDCLLQIVATGSFVANRFGQAIDVMSAEGLKPDWQINSLLEADNMTTAPKTTALQLSELASAFMNLAPDIVVTIADRYETMATAVAASYMNIPLAHVQGGEVTGNIDEKVRHAVTKLADLHLVASEDARERVLRLGERPEAVHMTGCPSIDIARQVAADERAWRGFDPFEHYRGVGEPFDPGEPFVVVLQHPVTTQFDEARRQMSTTLAAIHELKIPAIVFWPNPDSGTEGVSEAIRSFREQKKPRSFYFYKNLKPDDFMRLLLRASCLVGNSSVGLRECSYLGVPVVNIGDRQRGRVRCANVRDVAADKTRIKTAISAQVAHGRYPSDHAYGDGKAGERIAAVLATAPLTIDKLITY